MKCVLYSNSLNLHAFIIERSYTENKEGPGRSSNNNLAFET